LDRGNQHVLRVAGSRHRSNRNRKHATSPTVPPHVIFVR
jgi:hypothetical protein